MDKKRLKFYIFAAIFLCLFIYINIQVAIQRAVHDYDTWVNNLPGEQFKSQGTHDVALFNFCYSTLYNVKVRER